MNKLMIAAMTGLLAMPVLAQDTPPAPSAPGMKMMKPAPRAQTRSEAEARVRDRLGAMDANKDGTVSSDEMKAFAQTRMKERSDEMFAAMDTDKNGSISRAEFDAHHAKGPRRFVMRSARGDAPTPPGTTGSTPPAPDKQRMRMMIIERGGSMMMAEGGNGIVIADAVKKALERFDAADTNKDGTLTPEERRANRPSRWQWQSNRT